MIDTKRRDEVKAYGWTVAGVALTPVVLAWWLTVAATDIGLTDAVFPLVIVVVFVVMYATTMTAERAGTWALQRGAKLKPEWQACLARHLIRTRVARAVGITVAIGAHLTIMAGIEVGAWYRDTFGGDQSPWMMGLGYVLASVWAELTKPRLDVTGVGTAMLARRRLRDFLDRGVWNSLMFFVAIAALATLSTAARFGRSSPDLPAVGWRHLGIVASLIVAVLALSAAALLCRRVERAPDAMSFAYEELTRTAATNALTGASVAMLGVYALELGGRVAGPTPPIWLGASAVLLYSFGFVVWFSSGTSLVFRTRRLERIRGGA